MKLQMSASQFAERIGKIETIEQAASEKVGEAPTDGNEYVRKDGTWTKPDKYSKAEADETFLKKTETPTLDNVYTKAEVDEKFEAKGTSYTKEETYTKTEVNERIPTVVDAYSKTESDERYPLKVDTVKTLPESMFYLISKYVHSATSTTVTDEDYNTILSYAPNEHNSYFIEQPENGLIKCDIGVASGNIAIYCRFTIDVINYLYALNIDRQTKEVSGGTMFNYNGAGNGKYTINQSVSDISGVQFDFNITLLTNGTGSKFLSDNGSYKEIDTSSLAAKSEVSQYLNMPNELLSAIFNTTGDTATDENYATIVKYVPAGENKVFLGNMISLGLSGSGKFAITNNDEEITIIIDYQDSSSNQSTKSLIGINHSTKAVTFSRIINSISVKDSGLTIYGNKRKADGTSLSKTIDLITNGTGSKYLSDDGSYKEINTSNLATKDELAQVFVMSEALQTAVINVSDGDQSQLDTLISLVPVGTRRIYLPRGGTDSGVLSYAQYVYIYRPNTTDGSDVMFLSFIGLMAHMNPSIYPLYNICATIDCTNKSISMSSGMMNVSTSDSSASISGVENGKEYNFELVSSKNVCKRFFTPKSVSTLTNLPVDTYSIAATISEASTLSFVSTPQNGMEFMIDIKNESSSSITQNLPSDSNWQCNKSSVIIAAGKIAQVSVRYIHNIYCVNVLDAE